MIASSLKTSEISNLSHVKYKQVVMEPDDTICWLRTNHDLRGTDQRAWEREHAKALSHAARKGHRTREARRRQVPDQQLTSPPTRNFPTVRSVFSNSFITFPPELSLEDKELLHGYLVNVPREIYGTSATSSFCPVRDVTLGILSNNRILLSWAMLFMQHRIALLRDTDPFQDTRVLLRRRQTYMTMGIHIYDQQSAISEQAMYGLAFSALLEDRIGDQLTAQKHLQACLIARQLRVQNGLTVLSYPMGTLCIPVCIQVGIPAYFTCLEAVRNAGSILQKLLWSLQVSSLDTAQTVDETETATTRRCLWIEPVDVPSESAHEGCDRSTLRYHLTRSCQETSTRGMRLCLALLTVLSVTLRTLLEHGEGATEFLNLITHCFSESTSSRGAEKCYMTTLGMLYTAFMCIDRIHSTMLTAKCVIDLWQTVDIVEFLTFAPPSSQARVRQTLLHWILEDVHDDAAPTPCDDIFHEYIIKDVETSWLARQTQEIAPLQNSSSYRCLPVPAPTKIRFTSSCTELTIAPYKRPPAANPGKPD